MTQPELVRCEGVEVRHGQAFRLEIPSLVVKPGAVVGVVGQNGAGKTTLLNLLAGFSRPDRGAVRVFGLDPMQHVTQVRTRMGYMSDDMPLFDLRIGSLLRMVSGYYQTWDAALVEELLQRFELVPHKRVRDLSKGEGTRIRLVLALAFRPALLVLDEPATGLDVVGRRRLMEVVLSVVRDPQRSVIISSHQLHDLERIADTLVVLEKGRLVRQGPTEELVGAGRTLEEAVLGWMEGKP